MLFLRKLLKTSRVIWAFAYSLTGLVITRPKTRRDRAAWLSRFCRRVLKAADITWSSRGPVPASGAVITNHLTYLDILLHASLRPCVFVSAIEIRHMPLIGWISMMAGTVYVVRGGGGSAAQAAGGMADGFRDGLPVIFFPEGGTGIGDEPLLPLRTGLLANSLAAQATVSAGFIGYEISPVDAAAGRSVRNDVAWGTQTLPAHLWNLLGLRAIHASVHFADKPIEFSDEAFENRKTAANEARAAVLLLSAPR